jgi:hypothetical protein
VTVAHDTALQPATFTTASPYTFTYTPVGAPKGVVVNIYHGDVSTDLITGAVKYGTATLTRITRAVDTQNEPGAVYQYFYGGALATGTQTVSITHSGTTNVKVVSVCTVTAATSTRISVSAILQENQADPRAALDSGADDSLRYCVVYSGQASTANVALVSTATMTAVSANDFGAFVGRVDRQTTHSTGVFTIGYTSTSDDVAFSALAIAEEPPEIGVMGSRAILMNP